MFDSATGALCFEDRESSQTPTPSEDEETMQAYVNGAWHRRFLQRSETACGDEYHSQFTTLRREALSGPLCQQGCFTTKELTESQRIENEQYESVTEPNPDNGSP